MGLLISENDRIKVDVFYIEKDNKIEILDGASDGCDGEVFWFRRPSWVIINKMIADSFLLLANGQVGMNPFVFEELKLKRLLVDWTCKDGEGKKLAVNEENINKISPVVWDYLSKQIDPYVNSSFNSSIPNQESVIGAEPTKEKLTELISNTAPEQEKKSKGENDHCDGSGSVNDEEKKE